MIPAVSGVVGWGTNLIAVQMTFYPLEFKPFKVWQPAGQPFGLFGWQGIIPAKTEKMTTILTKLWTEKLIDVKAVFQKVSPTITAELCRTRMAAATTSATRAAIVNEFPALAHLVPDPVLQLIVQEANRDAPRFLQIVLEEMGEHLFDVFDVLDLTVKTALANKGIVVSMFQEIGHVEFRFVINSGFYFGTLLGLILALIYWFYQAAWVLPVAGFLVGFVTNYLALLLIFKPLEPHLCCGMNIQGIFQKRKDEVSVALAQLATRHFFKIDAIWEHILQGSKKDEMRKLLVRSLDVRCVTSYPTFGQHGVVIILYIHTYIHTYMYVGILLCQSPIHHPHPNPNPHPHPHPHPHPDLYRPVTFDSRRLTPL